jgi:hypothetical protein
MEDDWEAAKQLALDLAPANEAENKRKTSAKATTSKVAETLNVVEKKEAGEKRRQEEIAAAARRAVDIYEAELAAKEQGKKNARIPTTSATANKGERVASTSGTADGNGEGDVAPTNNNWGKMTVVQLKDELRNRGLKVSGRKTDLIERLQSSS